ncbi:MAG: DUF433 domain-containing protein [Candidatus Binatia bacterium]
MRNRRIELNPHVLPGQAVIRGTCISVSFIVKKITAGATLDDLLKAYPRLTREDIHAALSYVPGTSPQPPSSVRKVSELSALSLERRTA